MEKICIGNFPTPIYKLDSLSKEYNRNIFIKRDDYSGMEISGNKVRKLEYLIKDALNKNCDTIITTGGVQSNHARATAAVCAQYGFDCYLVLEGSMKEFEGNLFLDYAFGAKIIYTDDVNTSIDKLIIDLKNNKKNPYLIPMGGSNNIGAIGYVDEFLEILNYENKNNINFDTITIATGSGGTYSGLYYANEYYKTKKQILGISVNKSKEFFKNEISNILLKMHKDISTKNILIDDNFIGLGYGIYTEEDIKFYIEISKKTGILFDPCYTGKAFKGFCSMIKKEENKNKNHLLIHTGGIFGWTKEMRNTFNKIKED